MGKRRNIFINFRNKFIKYLNDLSIDLKNLEIDSKRNVPYRTFLYLFFVAVGMFYNENFIIEKEQFFWLMSSLLQGFSAFVGIIIASLALGTNEVFIKNASIKKLDRLMFMPILTSLITILISIIGLTFYSTLNKENFVGSIVAISFISAIWSIGEILCLVLKVISKN